MKEFNEYRKRCEDIFVSLEDNRMDLRRGIVKMYTIFKLNSRVSKNRSITLTWVSK